MGSENAVGSSTLVHPRFGPVTIKEHNGKHTILASFPVRSKADYDQWVALLPSYQQNLSLLNPLDYSFLESGLCGLSGKALVHFEYFPYSLEKEVLNRKEQQQKFKQSQVWYMLFVLLQACVDFERLPDSSAKRLDIKPKNILLNAEGQAKLLSQGSFPGFKNGYQAALQREEPSFLSPEQADAIAQRSASPKLINSRCEVFSVGVVVLEMCSLKPCIKAYEKDSLNTDMLVGIWDDLVQQGEYSHMLTQLARLMIQKDPRARLSAGQLWNMFLPYEEEIFMLRPFNYKRDLSEAAVQVYYSKLAEIESMAEYLRDRPFRKPYCQTKSSQAGLNLRNSLPLLKVSTLTPK